jgi:hypothetical protein
MMNKQPLKVALTFLSVGAVILTVLLLLSQSLYGQRILEGGPTEYPKCITSNVTHTFCEYIVFANQTVVENPHNKSMVLYVNTTGVTDEINEEKDTDQEGFDKAAYDREQEGLEKGENPEWAEGNPHCDDPEAESSEGCWELDD